MDKTGFYCFWVYKQNTVAGDDGTLTKYSLNAYALDKNWKNAAKRVYEQLEHVDAPIIAIHCTNKNDPMDVSDLIVPIMRDINEEDYAKHVQWATNGGQDVPLSTLTKTT